MDSDGQKPLVVNVRKSEDLISSSQETELLDVKNFSSIELENKELENKELLPSYLPEDGESEGKEI